MENLKQTPLLREHLELEAQMTPFGGWYMPLRYSGILAEALWCREHAALFDTCHMGEFLFRGDFEKSGLERLFSCRLQNIAPGRGRYGFLLNERGGIVDDLVIFRLADDEVMIVVNSETTDKDFQTIRSSLAGDFGFSDVSNETGKLDLQGPLSGSVMEEVCGVSIADISFFGFKKMNICGVEAFVSRTGYTGELGYEIYAQRDAIAEIWRRFLSDDRVRPAGLGARDVLRQEMGYCLYGTDIDEAVSPLEAGLSKFVDFGKDFVGKDELLRLQREGLSRIRAAFRINSRRSPRHGYQVYRGEQPVGRVTSGVFSPTLGCGIGMGYVVPDAADPGTELLIRHDDLVLESEVARLPFYTGGSLRK